MDMKLITRLLTIVSVLILIAGIIFLGISIFGDTGRNDLAMALGCICLANLFNVIRMQMDRVPSNHKEK